MKFLRIQKDFKPSQNLRKQLYGINVEENNCDFVDELSWQSLTILYWDALLDA